MPSKQDILKELEIAIGKRWPLNLHGVVSEIGSAVKISKFVVLDQDDFWDLNREFLHNQSDKFINYFYSNYKKRHGKTKKPTTATKHS